MSRIELTPDSLVVLVGASGSGKSTWARQHFAATQIVSSDRCRALVSDDETDQTVSREAFAVFYTIVRQRLSLGRLTVADSTALQPFSRQRLREIAAAYRRPAHAVVFIAPPEALVRNNALRSRRVPEPVLLRHAEQVAELLARGALEAEGYAAIHYLHTPEARAAAPLIVAPGPPPPPPAP